MHIGIDASRASRSLRTGTEVYSLSLIRALVELDCPHTFTLYFNQPPDQDLLPKEGRVRWRVMPFPRLWTHLRLSWEMLRAAPDVLFIPAHVIPLIHPRCTVVTVHDLGYIHQPEAHPTSARRYLAWSTRYNAKTATRVIADSEATRQDLVHLLHIPEEKIRVVHLGVHPRFRPVTDRGMLEGVRQRYHIPGEYILYVGTLQPRKNVVRLIEAFARVHCALEQGYNGIGPFDQTDTRRSLHLVLAGARGWQDQRMADAIVRLGLGPWVHLIGYVDEADLPALYSGARVFVLPSLWEGFGLPILEAMACGTPVVAANVSSLPEVVGDAGLLADPKDVGALARALMHVVMDPELSIRLRRRGLQRAAQFTWQRCAEATLAVLEEARQIA